MPFARAGSADIYWKVEGVASNPPLVLLNSIGTDMDLWEPALPTLRCRFALLRIDTRGHGASDAPEGDYTLGELAADVATVMDAAEMPMAAVAGVSLGGMIAMQLALDAPARVSGLALVCTSAGMDQATWSARVETVRSAGMAAIVDLAMSRFLSPAFALEQPEIVATVRRGLLGMAAAGYAGCAAAIRDMTLEGQLSNIACPTLVVTGDRDTSTPFAGHGEHLAYAIADARHVQIAAAHLAPLEAAQPLAAAIVQHLA